MTREADRFLLAGMLESQRPFVFVKFGDGEFECMAGGAGQNCDGQEYSPDLQRALIESWQFLTGLDNARLTCWCPERIAKRLPAEVSLNGRAYLDHDALLFHEMGPGLEAFYRVLMADRRQKVLVAPTQLAPAATLLGCHRFVEVPRPGAFSCRQEIFRKMTNQDTRKAIFLFCAGPAAKVLIADLIRADQTVTCLDLGSALDPIYIGETRTGQPIAFQARQFFARLIA